MNISEIEMMRAHELAQAAQRVGPLMLIMLVALFVIFPLAVYLSNVGLERQRRQRSAARQAAWRRRQRRRETEEAQRRIELQKKHREAFRKRQSTVVLGVAASDPRRGKAPLN